MLPVVFTMVTDGGLDVWSVILIITGSHLAHIVTSSITSKAPLLHPPDNVLLLQ